MRTISAAQEAVLASTIHGEALRVEVKDGGGTWRDLSSYPGYDSVASATVRGDIDSPCATATVQLLRELDSFSLAPLMQASAPNVAFTPGGAYSPLLAINRELRISAAIVPADTTPASGDWLVIFHGRIDSIDAASGETVTLECRDLGGILADTWIEEERVLALAGASASTPVSLRTWKAGISVTEDEYILPSNAKRENLRYYQVATTGTTGATEPTWGTGTGIADNTAAHDYVGTYTVGSGYNLEAVIQNVISDWVTSPPTLYTPSATSYNITQYLQERTSVWDAIRRLSLLIGWDLRYKWRSGTAQFELTLEEPDRSSPSVARTFTSADYERLTSLKIEKSGIRNAIQVTYPDASTTSPLTRPKQSTVTVTDATSISDYGRLFMEITESSSSLIDSSSEATTLATAALNDLKDPDIDHVVEMAYGFPWVELNDYYTFTANSRHYSANQSLAVFAYEHTWRDGRLRTRLSCRGKPSAGFNTWHVYSVRTDQFGKHARTVFLSGTGTALAATAQSVIGGAQIIATVNADRQPENEEIELHLGSSSGFTPNSSTLISAGKLREITPGHLEPGTTYYAKGVPYIRNSSRIERAEPTAATSFVAGYVEGYHLNSETVAGPMPPNGSFESYYNTSNPPNHWTLETGTWRTDAERYTSDYLDGSQCVHFMNTAVAAKLRSHYFPVLPGELYLLEWWLKKVGTPSDNITIAAEWYNGAKSLQSTGSVEFALNTISTGWVRHSNLVAADAAGALARVYVSKTASATAEFYFDAITLRRASEVHSLMFGDASWPTTATTVYMQPGYTTATAPANEIKVPVSVGGVLRNLRINARTASTGVDHTATVRVNGSDTAITCSMASAATSASDTSNYVQVAAGDLVSIKVAATLPGGGPVAAADVIATLGLFGFA